MRSVGFSVRQCLADGFYIPWQIAAREVGVASRPGQRIRVRRSLEGVPGGEALARVAKPLCCLLHRPGGLRREPCRPKIVDRVRVFPRMGIWDLLSVLKYRDRATGKK